MKYALLGSVALILAACSPAAETASPVVENTKPVADATKTMIAEADPMMDASAQVEPVMAVKTKAVLIYADWCGSCKVLDPKVKAAQALGPIGGVEFVTLDYTNKDADAFFAAATEAGVGPAIKAYLAGTVKTGQLLLVDLDDQAVVNKITKDSDTPEIVTAIKAAVAAS